MTRYPFIAAALCLLAACGKSEAVAGQPAPETRTAANPAQIKIAANAKAPSAVRNVMRFERGVILDQTGFQQPMAAATLFVPYGWRSEGGVLWGQQFLCTNGYNFQWRATSPDGSSGVMVLPQAKWENTDYGGGSSTPGCSSAPYQSARDWITALAMQTFQGARIVDYRNRPDLLKSAPPPQRQKMPLGESQSWSEGGEALVAFNANGREMRASVAAVVSFNVLITDMSAYGQQSYRAVTAYAYPGWASYAPSGQLNFAFFEAIRQSMTPNPQWLNAISGHNTAIARVAIEEAGKRAAAIRESNEEIARIRQETWNAQQKSADWRAREFGEVLKGVETYADPDAPGGTVELSHTYENAYRMNDGSYVLTNDPNFEPYRDLGMDGVKLEAAQ